MQHPKKPHIKKVNPKCRVNGCTKTGVFVNGICERCKKRMTAKPKKAVKQVSSKRSIQNNDYLKLRLEFLEQNPICPITGNPATEIHHMKGRIGGLLTDVRYFLAVSRQGHQKIELNPLWAKENGYSLNRTHDKD